MAVGVPDLARGARVSRQGYVSNRSFVRYYEREFRSGAAYRHARFLDLEADVGMSTSPDRASSFVQGLRSALRSKAFRAQLVKQLLGANPGALRGVLSVTFGRVRAVGIGDEAVLAPMSIQALGGVVRIPFTIAAVRVDRVLEVLFMLGQPAATVSNSDVAALLKVAATHITSGLTPTDVAPPTITGTPQSGATLTASSGDWTNVPTAYAYAWSRCDPTGANCQPIDGATASTYTVSDGDVGSTLRVSVTATNAVASAVPAESDPTAVVTAATPPPTP
jgi:hypothetical protein